MAKKKESSLTENSSMSITDYIRTLIGGSSRQIQFQKLPKASAEQPGLMSAAGFKIVNNHEPVSFEIKAGEEIESPIQGMGAFFMFVPTTGHAAVCVFGSYVNPAILETTYNNVGGVGVLGTSGKVCIGRKTTNGTIYIQNNRADTITARVSKV